MNKKAKKTYRYENIDNTKSNKFSSEAITTLFNITCSATHGYTGNEFTYNDIQELMTKELLSLPLTLSQMKQALAVAIYFMSHEGMNKFSQVFYPDYSPWPDCELEDMSSDIPF